jgi:UDP-GlcNAc:undecaprenyl-phosphate GlcNAc-1-phosphate transferase
MALLISTTVLLFVPGGLGGWVYRSLGLGVAVALLLALVGLVDDMRPLPPLIRLAAQIAASIGVWAIGFRVAAAPWDWANFVLTVVWMVGITNAFNLLDNMDGLSAGLAGVGAVSFAAMGVLEELTVLSVVAAGLAGAASGFLLHNRHPAKTFMGDAGSTFLGFLLALIGLELRFDNLVSVTFLVPVVVLGVPIFDTTLVVFSRIRHGRRVLWGGRDHVSHRLTLIGFPIRMSVGLLYWCGACLGWLGLVISRSTVQVGWMLLGFTIALGVFFGALLWNVPVYEPASEAALRRAVRGEARQD